MSHNPPSNLSPGTEPFLKAVTGTSAAPSAADAGVHTRHHTTLHLLGKCTGGTSADVTMWAKFQGVNEWAVFMAFGTNGVYQFTTAAPASEYLLQNIEGVERVYFQVSAIVGATLDLWVGANSAANE